MRRSQSRWPAVERVTSLEPQQTPCGAGKGRVLGNRNTSNPTAAAGKADVPLFGVKPQRAAQQAASKVDVQQAAPKLKSVVKSAAPSAPQAAGQVHKQANKAADTVKAAAPKVCDRLKTEHLCGGCKISCQHECTKQLTYRGGQLYFL